MTTSSRATYTLGILTFLIFFFFFLSTPSQAYFTTNQSTRQLENGTNLFLIEYRFGMEKYDVYLPIHAKQGTETKNDAVSFEIYNEKNEVVQGNTTAIVLSDTAINTNGMYRINKGDSKKLTLAVFFTPASPDADTSYSLQVTHLPFNFNGTQQLQLNPSELKYYTTKSSE